MAEPALFLQIVLSKNSRNRPVLSKEEMMALQARHDDCGDGSGGEDSSILVTMEMAISSWSAVDCRCILFFLRRCSKKLFSSYLTKHAN